MTVRSKKLSNSALAPTTPRHFQTKVLNWFKEHGRKELPWQQNISPYRVWLSEIMLQQTQVNTVIPYFQRFVARFPDLLSLALAHEDEVLQHWTGLGYYARARNLYRTAQLIAQEYSGNFPTDVAALTALPGIGRSTAGAIVAIALQQPAPILDGNVKRVLSRFAAIPGWPGNAKVAEILWQLAEYYTPQQFTREYTQAMMDLGATVCTRASPRCTDCPLQKKCRAFALQKVYAFPEAKPKKIMPIKQCYFLILRNTQQQFLLQKRPAHGIWGSLWCFPQFETQEQLQRWYFQQFSQSILQTTVLSQFRHTFSHYHLDITPIVIQLSQHHFRVTENNQLSWYDITQAQQQGLPQPVKRLLENFDMRT